MRDEFFGSIKRHEYRALSYKLIVYIVEIHNFGNRIVPFVLLISVTDERTYTLLCVPCFYEPPCEIQPDDQIDNEKNPKCWICPFVQNLS